MAAAAAMGNPLGEIPQGDVQTGPETSGWHQPSHHAQVEEHHFRDWQARCVQISCVGHLHRFR